MCKPSWRKKGATSLQTIVPEWIPRVSSQPGFSCFMFASILFRLSDTQECLESSLIEKENTLAKASEKLELINSLRESLTERESQYKEVSEKLLHTEHTVSFSSSCTFWWRFSAVTSFLSF